MNTHLTVMDMMRTLKISPEKYNNFKQWCYRHHEELDTRDCVWNHGYYVYNVDLVRLKCPYIAVENADKVSTPETIETPAETPLSAAERLADAINTATGQNVTGGDVLAAFERGKDYIRMRRTMARVLWRMRKERRACEVQVRACKWQEEECNRHRSDCYNMSDDVDKRYRELCDNERVACRAAAITMILYIITAFAFLAYVLS